LIKKEAENIQKYNDLKIEIWCLWNVKTEVTAKIIHKIPEQQPEEAYQGTTENSCGEHCTHSSGRTYVKTQKDFHGKQTLHVTYVVITEQLQHYIP